MSDEELYPPQRGQAVEATKRRKATADAAPKTLEERKALAAELGQIRNEDLYAGSPMYYYCRVCGLESDRLPEDWYRELPKRLCDACKEEGLG